VCPSQRRISRNHVVHLTGAGASCHGVTGAISWGFTSRRWRLVFGDAHPPWICRRTNGAGVAKTRVSSDWRNLFFLAVYRECGQVCPH
jgi:hypothetical protein